MSPRDFTGRLLSDPVEIYWAGWRSNTQTLQNNGWQLSALEDYAQDAMVIALRHEEWGMEGMTRVLNEWRNRGSIGAPRQHFLPPLRVGMRAFAREVRVTLMSSDLRPGFHPIDAQPQFYMGDRIETLGDLAHFATPMARTQELIIPAADPSVDELLARILEKQQPAREDYYRKVAHLDGQKVGPQVKFQAQILRAA